MAPKAKGNAPKSKQTPKAKPKAKSKVLTASQASECKKNFFAPSESAAKARAQSSAKIAKEQLAQDTTIVVLV